ncbi:hypothetical protein CDL15_Pgr011798 [Punica granatum]|uniref:Uncharacterized protein n=1 Tax=Punica granatum TaxID=22663 RepID=A0A218XEH5_PUNGR|nr:hypothetical protein CDL15_Pgr011798 [Punica granatum]
MSPNPLSVPSGVAKLCALEFRLVGARMRAPKCNAAWECPHSRERATDTREKESPPAILRPEGRGPASYPGLGAWGTPKMLRQWSVRNRKFRIRGFYYVKAYIPHAL